MSRVESIVAVAVAAVFSGCAGAPAAELGTVVAHLNVALPQSVQCVRLRAERLADGDVRLRTLSPAMGQVDLEMEIPLGHWSLSGQAWESPCPPSGLARWNADPVTIQVEHAAVPVAATLVFIRLPVTEVDGRFQEPVLGVALEKTRGYALRRDGVFGWGDNSDQLLGVGNVATTLRPNRIASFDWVNESQRVIQLAAGDSHLCGLRNSGEVWCRGRNNVGQLGASALGTPQSAAALKVVFPGPRVPFIVEIAAARDQTCARDNADALWCWGNNDSGQFGFGGGRNDKVFEDAPKEVTPMVGNTPVRVRGLALGSRHTCIRTADRAVRCAGANDHGQLGVGNQAPQPGWNALADDFDYCDRLWSGVEFTCLRRPLGQVYCWGSGGLGDGLVDQIRTQLTPAPVMDDMVEAHLAGASNFVVSPEGKLFSWGAFGRQLGRGSMVFDYSAAAVPVPGPVVRVAQSYPDFACAITLSGALWCWGRNESGSVGSGSFDTAPLPVQVLFPN